MGWQTQRTRRLELNCRDGQRDSQLFRAWPCRPTTLVPVSRTPLVSLELSHKYHSSGQARGSYAEAASTLLTHPIPPSSDSRIHHFEPISSPAHAISLAPDFIRHPTLSLYARSVIGNMYLCARHYTTPPAQAGLGTGNDILASFGSSNGQGGRGRNRRTSTLSARGSSQARRPIVSCALLRFHASRVGSFILVIDGFDLVPPRFAFRNTSHEDVYTAAVPSPSLQFALVHSISHDAYPRIPATAPHIRRHTPLNATNRILTASYRFSERRST